MTLDEAIAAFRGESGMASIIDTTKRGAALLETARPVATTCSEVIA